MTTIAIASSWEWQYQQYLQRRAEEQSFELTTSMLGRASETLRNLFFPIRTTAAAPPSADRFYIDGTVLAFDPLSKKLTVEAVQPLEVAAPQRFTEDLLWLKDSLGTGVSGLADLFGVTRKTIYDWLEGVEPKRDGRVAKISALRTALEGLALRSRYQLLRQVWNLPIENGRPLIEILRSGEGDARSLQEEIQGVLRSLEPTLSYIEQRNARSSRQGIGRGHTEDVVRGM